MSINEYNLCCHGYFMRFDRSQIPFRRLFEVLFNSNVSKGDKITSAEALYKLWPLSTDKAQEVISKEDMTARWRKAQDKLKKKKAKNVD